MIPLNEYPKEELKQLRDAVKFMNTMPKTAPSWPVWISRLEEAISDQEFKEKELPFKTEDNESREFEL